MKKVNVIPKVTDVKTTSEKERVEFLENQLKNFIAKDEEYRTEIKPDDYIKVMSLCRDGELLNLCSERFGRGRQYTFTTFGEVKRIVYSVLVEILEVNQTFLNGGLFYIMDERVIKRHGLEDVYKNILTKEKIEAIFSGNHTDALNLYKISNSMQQEMIRTMLIDKLKNDDEFNVVLVAAISKYSKVDLQEKAEEARQYEELNLNRKDDEN